MSAAAVGMVLAGALLLWPARPRPTALGSRRAGADLRRWRAGLGQPRGGARWTLGGATVVTALLALAVPWHAAVCAGLLAAVSARFWAEGRARRATAQRLARDVETLQAVASELRSGNHLATALRSAGTTADTAMCRALTRAAHAIDLGDDPASSLERTGAAGAAQLAGLVRLSGERGIALAHAVEILAADADDEAAAGRDVDSLLAGPRATAALLTLLPVFGLIMGQTIGADPWRVLLHSTAGAVAMVAGTVLAASGMLWTGALVRTARP